MSSRYFIYRIVNKNNNKSYIGKSKNYKHRWVEHKRNVEQGKQHPLYDAIRKHGLESFTFEVLFETTEDLVDAQEKNLIEVLSKHPLGYNLAEGGTGGATTKFWNSERWEEHRQKHNHKNYRDKKHANVEILKKVPGLFEKVEKGQITRQQAVQIRREAGIYTEAELLGQAKLKKLHNTVEVRAKKSKNATGKSNSRWLGYIQVFDAQQTLIGEYETAKQASQALEIPAHTIRQKAKSGEPYYSVRKATGHYGITFKFTTGDEVR
jgi:group I intron endonuclease